MPGDDASKEGLRPLTPICFGLLAAVPIYFGAGALYVFRANIEPPLSGSVSLLPESLAFVAVVVVLLSPVVKRLLSSPTRATVAAFAMRQSAGLAGLVITVLTGDLVWCATLCGVAFLAMVVDWPRRSG